MFLITVLGLADSYEGGSSRVPASAGAAAARQGRVRVIVRRPYLYLETRIRQLFEGRDDVEIIVDRRRGERRRSERSVSEERRRAERRKPREEILEMVIEGDPLAAVRSPGQDARD